MNDNKQSSQSRFLIAAALSMAVLLGWSYFFAPKPDPNKANVNANTQTAAANTQGTPAPAQTADKPEVKAIGTSPADVNPQKTVTVQSPLYKVILDSKGALATSWVLIKNVNSYGDKELWADKSTKDNKIPLELIPQTNPNREYPFRLATGNSFLDTVLNGKNYEVVGVSQEKLNISGTETVSVEFVLKDSITWTEGGTTEPIEVSKKLTFKADSSIADVEIRAKRSGQTIENLKLLIGMAIGDQGIQVHNYYQVEPEGVAYVGENVDRHVASAVVGSGQTSGKLAVAGEIDWAGVGDTYFGMAAIPSKKTSGLEYHGTKITKEVDPYFNGIFAWITRSKTSKVDLHLVTAHVPVAGDGSPTKVYVGSKDYFTLKKYNEQLSNDLGRQVHLSEFINFSWYWWFRPLIQPLAIGLLYCLTFIYGLVGNYGIAIIVFTLIFYSIFFPLRWYSSKSFKKAQANAPKMKELQDKMKAMQKKGVAMDDPKMRALQMEQLKMTKDAIPIGGCLPLLLQMPLFLAFFVAVTIGLDFRQSSFLWLPDLAANDPWHILEFLFAASMAGTMIFTPTAPAVTDEQKMQQKLMTYLMPIMMLWVMWGYPAGMLLYWFFGNIVSFGQQFIINHLNKTPETVETKA